MKELITKVLHTETNECLSLYKENEEYFLINQSTNITIDIDMSNGLSHYRHYKGGLYVTLYTDNIVLNHDTGELFVVYTDGNKVYARPYDMFHDSLIYKGENVKRFEKIK